MKKKTYIYGGKEYEVKESKKGKPQKKRTPQKGDVFLSKHLMMPMYAEENASDRPERHRQILTPVVEDKYEPKELDALNQGIKKWDGIAKGEGEDLGADNCELCRIYDSCSDCIIWKEGRYVNMHCGGIGYPEFRQHIDEVHKPVMGPAFGGYRAYCHECVRLALVIRDNLMDIRHNVGSSNKIEEAPQKKYYLKIADPEVAIGEGTINIIIEDEQGQKIPRGNLLGVTWDGALGLAHYVQEHIGLSLDSAKRIKLTTCSRASILGRRDE